jgi:PAS domain S-box-containing protein
MGSYIDARTNSSRFSWKQNYLLSIAAVAIATCAAYVFATVGSEEPFLFFFPAVLFSLAIGGFRIAVFSAVLSTLSAEFFLIAPLYSFRGSRHGLVKEVLFVATTVTAVWFFERHRNRAERFIRLQRNLLDRAAESILITDAAHRVVYWNQGAERLYGYTEQEAIGNLPLTLLECIYPEPLENIDRQLEESGRWRGRLGRKCKDGRTLITESSWATDEETGYILQTDLDITAQSAMESELKRVNRALNALSKLNRALIHPSDEAELLQRAVEVMVQAGGYPLACVGVRNDDPERTVRVAARAGEASEYLSAVKLSWAEDNPFGRGPCGITLREGQTVVRNDFLAAAEGRPWCEFARKFDLRSVASLPLIVQGETQAALIVYAREEDAFDDQEFSLVSEIAGDLAFAWTSLLLHQQAEEEHKSRLVLEEQLHQSQKMEAVGQLAGGISHDFNNLLMIIMGQIELLSMSLKGADRERAESVMYSAQRAAALTGQLLAFSRKQVVQPAILSLNQILADTARMAVRLVGEDVEIVASLCQEPWPVKVDRSQLEQVIMNLIVNARDAMPDGGKLTIESSNIALTTEYLATHPLVPPGKYVLLAVSDNGTGMSEETKTHLFEPFFTTKPLGKGTGLGLSVVYGIVKQNNGFVWYYSELGRGTTFKVYLPAAQETSSSAKAEPSHLAAPAKEQVTILLVEDERPLREVIADFLHSGGYRVIAAESEEEALARAAEHVGDIDLLLTDVVLRGRNGRQLADELHAQGCNFQVIFMSGYTPNAILHHGMLDESTLFLQKPFSRTTLLAKVQKALHPD